MGIVLRERTHAGQSVELTALLIAEDGTELSDAERQVFVRTRLAGIHLAVVRAVHWLEHVLLIRFRRMDGLEGVLAVVGIVAGGDIEVLRSNTRRDDLLIVVGLQHVAQQLLQAQTQLSTLRQPDGQTLTHTLGEHEQLHLLANLTVVALLGFLKHDEIFIEHLLLREGDAVDTRHLLAVGIATPESTGYTRNLDGLDGARRYEVRTTAEVGEVALGISGDGAILQILRDVLHLVLLSSGLKLLDGIGLRHFAADDGLILLGELLHLSLYLGEVVFRDGLTLGRHHIVEETILDGRAEAELDAGIQLLQRLGKQVGRRVPEGVLAFVVVELIQFDGSVGIDGAVEFCCLTINPARYNVAGESR